MRKVRWMAGTAAIIVVLTVVSGHAAGLTSATNKLAANKTSVSRCDTTGVTTLLNVTGLNVTSVAVSNVTSGCGNLTIKLTVNNGTTSSNGTNTVPAGGGSVTVTLALPVLMTNTEQVDIVIG